MDGACVTVFYPLNLQEAGYLYGWKPSKGVFCVAGVLQSTSYEEAQAVLERATETHEWKGLIPPKFPVILTLLGRSTSATPQFTLDGVPTDRWIIIFYRRPESSHMRFFSIEPLELDVTLLSSPDAKSGEDELSRRTRILCHADFSNQSQSRIDACSCVPVDHMNLAHGLSCIVERVTAGRQDHVWSIISERVLSSLSEPRFIRQLFAKLGWVGGLCASALFGLCNVPAPVFPFGRTRLKDLSACMQQIDVRLEQAMFLPRQFHIFQHRNRGNAAYVSAHYISFYNCIWLVLNDAIVGAAIGTFLFDNSTLLGDLLHNYARWLTVSLVRDALVWLDHWPAGLKLNTELSHFLCLCFMSLTDIWGAGLDLLAPYFPGLLRVIGIMGRLGVTMVLSLLSDLLSILTGHLYLSYLIATILFSNELSVAKSLWNLFRGKRRNVLRNRTDSWDYDIDQLLLGTILFTLVTFLFPTVLAYYTLFALVRLAIILLHATMETFLAFMNHFPLFAMMLRCKDPSRLPGGIYFEIKRLRANAIVLQNLPISISRIFFQHLLVWSRLSAHYHPLRLLRCLATGTPLTQISRYSIRYNMVQDLTTDKTNARIK